jgi:hypothetical protein
VMNFLKIMQKKIAVKAHVASSLLLLVLAAESTCLAQRLVIETPSAGPVARIFYGQINLQDVILFEKRYAFELDNEEIINEYPAQPDTSESNAKKPLTLATYYLKPDELKRCIKSTRFKSFLALASALKGRINSAKIQIGTDTDECAELVKDELKKSLGDIRTVSESMYDEGIEIELSLISDPIKTKPKNTTTAKAATPLTLDQLLNKTQIKISGTQIKVSSNGWFVFEVTDSSEQAIEIKSPGRKPLTIRSMPMLVSSEIKPITGSTSYKARTALFQKPQLKIYISETPLFTEKTSIDGGAGGGLGYGRQVPGERKGERIVSMIGIEQREILRSFGVRASLFYTNAGRTVVPNTVTIRGLGFYDFDLYDDSWAVRATTGMEIFYSQITPPKNRSQEDRNKSALIPSQVSSPIIGLSVHKLIRNKVTLGSSLFVTPLYVTEAGLYPSFSPQIELGYKFQKNLAAVLTAGSEVHRFPSVLGETKLQLDYLLLNFKRGLF